MLEHTQPQKMLVCTHTWGLAPVCLCWSMFLYMYVHGHMHIRNIPAASFSFVLPMYAMAITHAHGCTMIYTHEEPCAHVRGGAHTCEHCPDMCVTLPSSTAILLAVRHWQTEDTQDLVPVWPSPVAGKQSRRKDNPEMLRGQILSDKCCVCTCTRVYSCVHVCTGRCFLPWFQ